MNLPSQTEISAASERGVGLPGLIVGMRLSAGTKNPYRIYFPKTDAQGKAALSAAAIDGQFKDHWAEGLMDYNGTIDQALQEVSFFLLDVAAFRRNLSIALAWPLLPYERTVWKSRKEQVDYNLSCRNEEFRLDPITLRLPEGGNVKLQVWRANEP